MDGFGKNSNAQNSGHKTYRRERDRLSSERAAPRIRLPQATRQDRNGVLPADVGNDGDVEDNSLVLSL